MASARPGAGSAAEGAPQKAPGDAFTPTRPSAGRRHIVGRQAELERILLALRDERAHVVLYAERGSGKTSLSNLVIETLRRSGVMVTRNTCDAASSFDSIIRGLMRELPASLLAARAEGGTGEGCEPALPPGELRPGDVASLLSRLTCRSLVCVVDEFDRVQDDTTRTRLADTIKQVSDRGTALSFMVVGVSENLEEILGRHPSIQRNISALHLPLLDDEAVAALLARGSQAIALTFPPAVVATIVRLCRGMPYIAQLLGLRTAQMAFLRNETTVTEADLAAVVKRLIADTRPTVTERYAVLTENGQDAEMVMALRRIALARHDPWGRLDVAFGPGIVAIGGQSIPAECWMRLRTAGVLSASGAKPDLVAFEDRGLLTYILLLAAQADALLHQPGAAGHAAPNDAPRRARLVAAQARAAETA
jgi:hypothetical protein